MATFDRYTLSQLTVTFGFFAFILVAVYWVNRAIVLFEDLISDGHTALVFLEFTALALPNVILLVLPVAGFVASLYVANRLISESEMVVMQSAGHSAKRLMVPALIFGVGIFVMMSILSHILVPISRTALAEREGELSQDVTTQFLNAGRFVHPSNDLTIYVREFSETGELRDILLTDDRSANIQTIYTANRAFLIKTETGPRLVMLSGQTQTLNRTTDRLSFVTFTELTYDLSALIPSSKERVLNMRELFTPALLRGDQADLDRTNSTTAIFKAQAHGRFSKPLLGMILPLLGVAVMLVGGFNRMGVSRQILASAVIIILVQMLFNAGENAAISNPTMWPMIYLPIVFAVALLWMLLFLTARPSLFSKRKGMAA